MKREIKLLITGLLILVLFSFAIYLKFSSPSEEGVKQEYLNMRPNVEVVNVELIFDWEPKQVYTYLVKYREPSSDEITMDEFSIRQMWNFQWRWCSDQTERPCG